MAKNKKKQRAEAAERAALGLEPLTPLKQGPGKKKGKGQPAAPPTPAPPPEPVVKGPAVQPKKPKVKRPRYVRPPRSPAPEADTAPPRTAEPIRKTFAGRVLTQQVARTILPAEMPDSKAGPTLPR
jgi:hypothetical protein